MISQPEFDATALADELTSLYRAAISTGVRGSVVYGKDHLVIKRLLRTIASTLDPVSDSISAEITVVPVYMNMRTALVDGQTFGWAMYFLAETIAEVVARLLQHQGTVSSVGSPDWDFMMQMPNVAILKYLRDVQRAYQCHLVLILDEFTEVLGYEKCLDLDGLFKFFKGLIDSRSCSFLLGGDLRFEKVFRFHSNAFAVSKLVNIDTLAQC